MNVELSTVLDAPAPRVWQEVETSRLLEYVAAPLQTFEPIRPPDLPLRWHEGEYLVRLRLLGILPIGSHRIVISFPLLDATPGRERYELRDRGGGRVAGTWDHRIIIEALSGGQTRYIDRVEVRAGLLTPLVWGFAQVFYRHRQRRWRRLVRDRFRYS